LAAKELLQERDEARAQLAAALKPFNPQGAAEPPVE